MSQDRSGSPTTAPAGVLGRLRTWLPEGAAGRKLTLMSLIDAAGTGSFLAVSAIFLTRQVGLSVGQVGLGLSVAAGVGLVTTVPVAMVADRFGARRLLVLVTLWRAVLFVVYPFVSDFAGFLTVVILMGLVDKAAAPLGQVLVGMAVPEDQRVRTMAVTGALRNVGYASGALLGSVALVLDNRAAYTAVILCNALSFFLFCALAWRMPLLPGATGDASRLRRRVTAQVFRDRPYLTLALLNIVLTMHISLLSVGIPLWVATTTSAPRSVVSGLLVVNTVLAVLFQVRVSRGASDLVSAARLMRVAGFGLAACCALLAAVPSFSTGPAIGLLVLCITAMTVGELFQSAGGWGISYKLAKPGEESTYVSLFWLSSGAQQIVAPLVIAQVVSSGAAAWLVVAAVQVAAGLAVPLVTRWAIRDRESLVPAAAAAAE
ncbi:MFS transporter [Streptomyces sp. NPDC046727]|uniref:MFS transporter n=1 Tax=Streptomyces sp. NPDC046727 TaxID=3155373 RepID=UPI0033DB2F0D